MKVSFPKVEIALWNLGVRVSCLGEQGVAFLFEFANSLTFCPRSFSQKDTDHSLDNVQHCEMQFERSHDLGVWQKEGVSGERMERVGGH